MSFKSYFFMCYQFIKSLTPKALQSRKPTPPSTTWNHLIKSGEMMVPLQFSEILPLNDIWHEKLSVHL